MFLFKKKDKSAANKPPLPPSAGSAHKVKTAEEAKREVLQQEKAKEKEQTKALKKDEVERADEVEDEDEASRRRKASRRISQTQFGKPLSYNAYITQNKLNQPQ